VPIEVTMPKLSPTMESGRIAQWMVKVGDQVKEGDVLADVETDKATMPMKSFEDGTVAHLDCAPGDEVVLGQRVMVLAEKGEDPKKVAESLGAAQKAAAGPEGERTKTPTRPEATPAGANGQEPAQAATAPEPAGVGAGGRVKSSPLARKVAAEAKVDVSRVPGSGPGGRVVRRDVESYVETRGKAPQAASRAAAPGRGAAAQRIPHTTMRRTIAKRMTQAKQEAPEIHVTVDIRVDEVVAVRERLNKQLAAEKLKLSLGDFVTKAVALALRAHPGVNASFEPDAIVQHAEVNVGIAVALPNGLMVPVLHDADVLGLREIRVRSEQLVDATRSNKLTGEQLDRGTFTVSNLGMYGVREFDAILNPPQVGILAVGAAEKRPVVSGDSLEVGTVMTVTLTADHRAVDGALAAEFLRTLKGLLEEPASMLL
jgi:pyruvate dehydrogenase E2 component (dihydrolipoamide acetyltransferase)